MSKIEDKAKEVLEKYKVNKVFATDGQVFIEENRAILHANAAGKPGKPLKIQEFTSAQAPQPPKGEQEGPQGKKGPLTPKGGTVEATEGGTEEKQDFEIRAEKVAQAATIEEVEKLLEGETSKTVQKAGAKRISDLKLQNHGDTDPQPPKGEGQTPNEDSNTDKQ